MAPADQKTKQSATGPCALVECSNVLKYSRRGRPSGDFRGRTGFWPAPTCAVPQLFYTPLFSTWFSTSIFLPLGSILDPNLGLCWELFGYIFDLKLGSYVEVDFLSIYNRFLTPLAPQKLSPRLGENQIFKFLYFLS